MNRFDACLDVVLRWEGGWADHPEDPGGATMRGVTIGTYSQWKGRSVTKDELRAISDAEVRAIYRRNYWDKVRGDDLLPGIDLVAFDAAVNSGPARSIRWLQEALEVETDGKMGPATLAAAAASDPHRVIAEACDLRLAWLRLLRHWPTFGRGWENRVTDVRQSALRMALAPVPAPEAPPAPAAPAPAPTPTSGLMARLCAALLALFARKG